MLKKIILAILVLLSLAAGAVKVLQLPDEVNFFQGAGLGVVWVVVFGAVQLLGGVLLFFCKDQTHWIGRHCIHVFVVRGYYSDQPDDRVCSFFFASGSFGWLSADNAESVAVTLTAIQVDRFE